MTKLKADTPEPTEITAEVIVSYAGKIDREKDQVQSHAGKIAGHFKEFGKVGGNKAALRAAMKLNGMEEHEAQAFVRDFGAYCGHLEVFKTPDLFDGAFGGAGERPAFDPTSAILRVVEASKSEAHPQQHQAGRKAAESGQPVTANPNPVGCDHWQGWQNGWIERQHEMANAEPPTDTQPKTNGAAAASDGLMATASAEGHAAGMEGKDKDSNPYDDKDARFPTWDRCYDKGAEHRATRQQHKLGKGRSRARKPAATTTH